MQRTIVAMSLCIRLLYQWQPSILAIATSRKIQGLAAFLQSLSQLGDVVAVVKGTPRLSLIYVLADKQIVAIRDMYEEPIIDDFWYPGSIAEEDETIHTNSLITGYAKSLHKSWFRSDRDESRNEPAVSEAALHDIVTAGSFRVERGLLENVL